MEKIGIVDVDELEGGRRTFIDDFARALIEKGYDAHIIDIRTISLGELNRFDILHFSTHYFGINTWKLLLAYRPKKILTVHGLVAKEILYTLKNGKPNLKTAMGGVLSLVLWNVAPLFFNAMTCPSKRKKEDNNLKSASVITNAIFPEDYLGITPIDVREIRNDVILVTYSSVGGFGRNLERIVRIVCKLNRKLEKKRAILLIFGTKFSQSMNSNVVRFMGYSSDFLRYLKGSDLYIHGLISPELGYVAMESAALGVPMAKLSDRYETEEIVDGQTGILAMNELETVQKLLRYVADIDCLKPRLGASFHEYVVKTRSWDRVILRWEKLFFMLLRKQD